MVGGLLNGVWRKVPVGGCALDKGRLETQVEDQSTEGR